MFVGVVGNWIQTEAMYLLRVDAGVKKKDCSSDDATQTAPNYMILKRTRWHHVTVSVSNLEHVVPKCFFMFFFSSCMV